MNSLEKTNYIYNESKLLTQALCYECVLLSFVHNMFNNVTIWFKMSTPTTSKCYLVRHLCIQIECKTKSKVSRDATKEPKKYSTSNQIGNSQFIFGPMFQKN